MNEAQAIEALSKAFVTTWPTLEPFVPFAIENEFAALPTLPPFPPEGADKFALFTIVQVATGQLTMGSVGTRLVQRRGVIQVKLWTTAGTRVNPALQLVESVRQIFEIKGIAGPIAGDETIDTETTDVLPIGLDGRWYMLLTRTPYRFFETK